jgi:hypothetical protein
MTYLLHNVKESRGYVAARVVYNTYLVISVTYGTVFSYYYDGCRVQFVHPKDMLLPMEAYGELSQV